MTHTDQIEGPIYTRSNGSRVLLKDMVTNHLKSALAKLERDFPDHEEVGPMAAEVARREAEFTAQQQEQSNEPS